MFVPIGMEQVVLSGGERAQVQSVLLLTDGLANEGIKDTDGILAEMMKLQNPPSQGDVTQKVSERKYIQTVDIYYMSVCSIMHS